MIIILSFVWLYNFDSSIERAFKLILFYIIKSNHGVCSGHSFLRLILCEVYSCSKVLHLDYFEVLKVLLEDLRLCPCKC